MRVNAGCLSDFEVGRATLCLAIHCGCACPFAGFLVDWAWDDPGGSELKVAQNCPLRARLI